MAVPFLYQISPVQLFFPTDFNDAIQCMESATPEYIEPLAVI